MQAAFLPFKKSETSKFSRMTVEKLLLDNIIAI